MTKKGRQIYPNFALALFLLASVLLVSGCATPAKPQAMVVQPSSSPAIPQYQESLKSSFWVNTVSGGKETNPLWTSEVGNAEFQEALTQSLRIAGLLAQDASSSRYKVSATLKELKQPLIGVTFKVNSSVDYLVVGGNDTQTIPINAVGVGTVSDSWVGVSRLRIASEKSIQENIKAFMKRLGDFE